MRLINNESLALEFFMGTPPAYAILSHTWEDEEVTFEDFTDADPQARTLKKGFGKIAMTCELARRVGLTHSWVDTCCIDKRSSAELTEAINSMFQWYAAAAICFAWLADLAPEAEAEAEAEDAAALSRLSLAQQHPHPPAQHARTILGLKQCRWFTRGWTLQELIAPRIVQFYDRDWHFRGTKANLSAQLTRITSVNQEVLANPAGMRRLSVAARMAWAAGRETTRAEDMAYCLLGIFDVNMPMLYGEGDRAFLRLQEAIASQTNDLSLFAWMAQDSTAAAVSGQKADSRVFSAGKSQQQTHRGVFASSPAEFRGAASIQLLSSTAYNPEFIITNKGLRMNARIFAGEDAAYFLGLNCAHVDNIDRPSSLKQGQHASTSPTATPGEQLGIWIQQHGGGIYTRVRPHEHARQPPGAKATVGRIFLARAVSAEQSLELEGSQDRALVLRRGFNDLATTYSPAFPFYANMVLPEEQFDRRRRMFVTQGTGSFAACAQFLARYDCELVREEVVGAAEGFFLAFGWRSGEEAPWVSIVSVSQREAQLAMGNADKMAAAIGGRENSKASLMVRDVRGWITKVIHVSVDAVATEGRVVYYIDMDIVDAPEHVLKGPHGALSHKESALYQKTYSSGQRQQRRAAWPWEEDESS
ncbi:HET-domain-containing protein [Parathielavia appendiculata]|uniref:HET-domain-containing protein n=1 Tax=Parathielavia appendiculata TaxID=2587402 RepID=A0AAN6YYW9_9PEZI|nr:HET-domain-containing protein [Parathielavia appendiculata]